MLRVHGISCSAPEPAIAGLIGRICGDSGSYGKYGQAAPKSAHTYHTFVTEMLCHSAILAHRRVNEERVQRKERVRTDIDINDPATLARTKQIFKELCFLNGIDPETMLADTAKEFLT